MVNLLEGFFIVIVIVVTKWWVVNVWNNRNNNNIGDANPVCLRYEQTEEGEKSEYRNEVEKNIESRPAHKKEWTKDYLQQHTGVYVGR